MFFSKYSIWVVVLFCEHSLLYSIKVYIENNNYYFYNLIVLQLHIFYINIQLTVIFWLTVFNPLDKYTYFSRDLYFNI